MSTFLFTVTIFRKVTLNFRKNLFLTKNYISILSVLKFNVSSTYKTIKEFYVSVAIFYLFINFTGLSVCEIPKPESLLEVIMKLLNETFYFLVMRPSSNSMQPIQCDRKPYLSPPPPSIPSSLPSPPTANTPHSFYESSVKYSM